MLLKNLLAAVGRDLSEGFQHRGRADGVAGCWQSEVPIVGTDEAGMAELAEFLQ